MMTGIKLTIFKNITIFLFVFSSLIFAEKLPETHSLLSAPVKECSIAENTIYAIYSNSFWKCKYGSQNWKTISKLPFKEEGEILKSLFTIWSQPRLIYLLSSKYLYISRDGGLSWLSRKLKSETREYNNVCVFPKNKDKILFATSDGVWISNDEGQTFERFFSRINKKENYINDVNIDMRGDKVYVATAASLFVSSDKGKTFRNVLGLPNKEITHLAISPLQANILCFISNGRLFYSETNLENYSLVSSLYDFSKCGQVSITANGKDVIWNYPGGVLWGKDWLPPEVFKETAALPVILPTNKTTDILEKEKQLLKNKNQKEEEARKKILKEKYEFAMKKIQSEPSARDVVNAAIEYAKLHPDRIKDWMKNIRKSAWMPELRLLGGGEMGDIDRYGRNGDIGLNPLFLYRKSEHSRENDYKIEAELSWKLEKFFFDEAEIGIDEQRNRQTELREDIANTVTIYYFQRRNLMFNKLFNPPEDFTELSRLEFQIEEITTKIDTLSGGYFIKQLNSIKKNTNK